MQAHQIHNPLSSASQKGSSVSRYKFPSTPSELSALDRQLNLASKSKITSESVSSIVKTVISASKKTQTSIQTLNQVAGILERNLDTEARQTPVPKLTPADMKTLYLRARQVTTTRLTAATVFGAQSVSKPSASGLLLSGDSAENHLSRAILVHNLSRSGALLPGSGDVSLQISIQEVELVSGIGLDDLLNGLAEHIVSANTDKQEAVWLFNRLNAFSYPDRELILSGLSFRFETDPVGGSIWDSIKRQFELVTTAASSYPQNIYEHVAQGVSTEERRVAYPDSLLGRGTEYLHAGIDEPSHSNKKLDSEFVIDALESENSRLQLIIQLLSDRVRNLMDMVSDKPEEDAAPEAVQSSVPIECVVDASPSVDVVIDQVSVEGASAEVSPELIAEQDAVQLGVTESSDSLVASREAELIAQRDALSKSAVGAVNRLRAKNAKILAENKQLLAKNKQLLAELNKEKEAFKINVQKLLAAKKNEMKGVLIQSRSAWLQELTDVMGGFFDSSGRMDAVGRSAFIRQLEKWDAELLRIAEKMTKKSRALPNPDDVIRESERVLALARREIASSSAKPATSENVAPAASSDGV